MRLAALVVGLCGAVVAFLTALVEVGVGGAAALLGHSHPLLFGLSALAGAASLAGLVGALLAPTQPRAAAWCCGAAAVALGFAASALAIPGAVLLAVAALLAGLSARAPARA